MKTKQRIEPGTTILRESPFVYVLSSKVRTEYCDHCFNKVELSKCSACHYVYYCGKHCQKSAWPLHKLECRSLKQVAPRVVPDAARLLARLIRILENDGQKTRGYYAEGKFRMFKDLMSHYSDLKEDKTRMEHFTSVCAVLFELLGNSFLPNSAELMGMYGRMCINSFNICNQDFQCIGTGIYLAASIIDHSCDPNAVAIFEGTTLNIRNTKPIEKLDFTQVFISYIDILNTPKNRQEELQTLYYFTCQCPRCLDPKPLEMMTAAACPDSKCDGYVNMSEKQTKCSKCSTEITEEFIREYKEVTEFTEMHLQNMKHTAFLDVCKICLKKQAGVLYKYNIQYIKTLDLAFESSIDFGQWDDAKRFGMELVEGYRMYYGEIHPLLGYLYLKVGKILVFEGNDSLALKYLKNAFDVLKITHGTSNAIFKELMPLIQQANEELQAGGGRLRE